LKPIGLDLSIMPPEESRRVCCLFFLENIIFLPRN
jgi:hypothetical protein